ncbi:MAG: hypothetical protein LBQ19_01040, partial [Synergistaceae bacterium]|nr:hypothetical protein [Synergistaceae bacterium]
NLRLFLGRVIGREASPAESRIIEMLGDGRLVSYFDEYAKISNERDPFLLSLLKFMEKKTIAEQWSFLDALSVPDAYLWPEDAPRESEGERLDALTRMCALPLKLETFEELTGAFVLPAEVLSSLRSVSNFASGVEQIGLLRDRGLLLPRAAEKNSVSYENLSLDEYIFAVRLHHLGHTSVMLEKLGVLEREFQSLTPPRDYEQSMMYFNTVDRLKGLKDKKIDTADLFFVMRAANLFEKRQKISGRRVQKYGVASVGGGLLFWLIRFVSGGASNLFFGLAVFFILALWGFYYLVFAERRYDVSPGLEDSLVYAGIPASLAILNALVPFSLLVGALCGFSVSYVKDRYYLSKNRADIFDACASYSTSETGGGAVGAGS